MPVKSSDIVSIGYDKAERVLEVEFMGSRIYQYLEVTPDIYEAFSKANSYGTYFYSSINGRYRYRRVDGAKDEERPDTIAFVTGNPRKYTYFESACAKFDIKTEQLELPVDEIQGEDPEKIAIHKAKEAYRLANRPVVVDDKYWSILSLHGFPGAYAHEMVRWFKPEDFLALMAGKSDRSVTIDDTLVYYDGKRAKVFSAVRRGVIVEEPRGSTKGSSLEKVTQLQGFDKTMGELHDEGSTAFEPEGSAWHEFAKWFSMQRRLGRA